MYPTDSFLNLKALAAVERRGANEERRGWQEERIELTILGLALEMGKKRKTLEISEEERIQTVIVRDPYAWRDPDCWDGHEYAMFCTVRHLANGK